MQHSYLTSGCNATFPEWHTVTFNLSLKGIVISTVLAYDIQPVYLVHVALAVHYHLFLLLYSSDVEQRGGSEEREIFASTRTNDSIV